MPSIFFIPALIVFVLIGIVGGWTAVHNMMAEENNIHNDYQQID